MNEKARKYIDMFRKVKIAAAATVDQDGHPQARIINVMLAFDDGMYIVTSRGKPFYKQLIETGAIALAAMCPDCQPLKFTGQLRTAVDRLFALEEGEGNLLRGNGRASVLLMAAEGHGFEDVLTYYDHLMDHLRWKNLGCVLAGGNMDVGDIQGKPELRQAYELGKSIQ